MCHRALQSQPFEMDTIRIESSKFGLTGNFHNSPLSDCPFASLWHGLQPHPEIVKLYFLILCSQTQMIDNSKTFSFLCFKIMFYNVPNFFYSVPDFFNNVPDWPQVLFLSPSPSSPSACGQICSRHLPTSFLQDAYMIYNKSFLVNLYWWINCHFMDLNWYDFEVKCDS